MKPDAPPLTRFYDLDRMSPAGDEVAISASADELVRLAEWAGVERVTTFSASIALKRLSPVRYRYEGQLIADLVQNCVVTLEPVVTHVERTVSRELHRVKEASDDRDGGGMVTLTEAEDEVPEEIQSPHFDLGAPLREELSLAVDPYPRAPGVVFEAPEDRENPDESPFAVLKRLKR
jgi:uncharacterized metal-binding protein YceD (DUF177 family)